MNDVLLHTVRELLCDADRVTVLRDVIKPHDIALEKLTIAELDGEE